MKKNDLKIPTIIDNFSSAIWFCMDACWMSGFDTIATVFAALTVAIHLLLFRTSQRTVAGKLAAVATNAWVLANVCWMLGDIYALPLDIEKFIFLGIGAVCIITVAAIDMRAMRGIRGFRL